MKTKNTIRTLAAVMLSAAAFTASAGVKMECERDPMTDAESCIAYQPTTGGAFSVQTTASGALMLGVVRFDSSDIHAAELLIRIDGAPVSRWPIVAGNARVDCSGAHCGWNNTVLTIPSRAQWEALAAGRVILAAPARGALATEPLNIDPARIREWLAALAARGYTPKD